jgi:hypothetical protein
MTLLLQVYAFIPVPVVQKVRMPARTIINASMHQPAHRIAVRFGHRRDPP